MCRSTISVICCTCQSNDEHAQKPQQGTTGDFLIQTVSWGMCHAQGTPRGEQGVERETKSSSKLLLVVGLCPRRCKNKDLLTSSADCTIIWTCTSYSIDSKMAWKVSCKGNCCQSRSFLSLFLPYYTSSPFTSTRQTGTFLGERLIQFSHDPPQLGKRQVWFLQDCCCCYYCLFSPLH